MKFTPLHFFVLFVLISVGGLIGGRYWQESQPGQYDQFAQCISDSGATFYGAFWCPHCNEQKDLFGNSEEFLPYVECSTPDRQNQTQACIDAEIKSYPTWELADGSRLPGVQSLEDLAEATACELTKS